MTTHWTLRLKSYGGEPQNTLLAQHDLLQLLADESNPSTTLTIRIVAGSDGMGGVGAAFYLLCEGPRKSAPFAATLLDVASVGLLSDYSIAHSAGTPEPAPAFETIELIPALSPNESLPIKPDWSPLFDLIRRHGRPMTIDLRCRYNASSSLRPTSRSTVLGSDPGTEVLEALNGSSQGIGLLSLEVIVSAPKRIDRTFATAIGRKLFGVGCQLVPAAGRAQGTAVSPGEALRVWHWPYGDIQGRGLGHYSPSLPLNNRSIPKRGTSLGMANTVGARADREVDVVMSADDRVKHIYIVGKTGSGKTNLLKRLGRQDIARRGGCLVITPHGDLIDHLIDTAGDRADDIVLLDFGDAAYAPQLNPLAIDIATAEDYARASEQLTDLVANLNYHEFTGPVFRDAVRTALQTAALPQIRGDRDPNIAVAIEIVRDRNLRQWAAGVARETRRDIELELGLIADLKASEVSEYVRWVTAKFSSFAQNGPLRAITSTGGSSPFSFRDIYEQQKVLLVHLPDTYLTGESAEFIGRFIFERLYLEARRTPAGQRKDFFVHADEFQRFVNRDLEVLVTEARKFRLGLAFAHQNLRQLHSFSRFEGSTSSRLAEAIFSNTGTLITMRTSGADVATMATELEVPERVVRRIAPFEALARATLGGKDEGAFTLSVPLETAEPDRAARARVRRRMIDEGYWARRAVVESDVDRHLAGLRAAADPSAATRQTTGTGRSSSGPNADSTDSRSSFLDDWLAKRREAKPVHEDVTDDAPSKGSPR